VAVLGPHRKKDGKKDYSLLAVLGPGDCFGELALLNNKPRSACIFTREKCSFGVLERHDYLRILGKLHEYRLSQKVDFLHRQPAFSSWTKTSLQKLSFYFKERQYKRKQALFRSGQFAEEVYVVKSGEFQLYRGVKVAMPRRFHLSKEVETALHSAEVTVLGTGEMLGDQEVLHIRCFAYTCVCASLEAEVFYMSKSDFLMKVGSEETATDTLRTLDGLKETYRSDRLSKISKLEAAKWAFTPAPTPIAELYATMNKEISQVNTIETAKTGLEAEVRKRWALFHRKGASLTLEKSKMPSIQSLPRSAVVTPDVGSRAQRAPAHQSVSHHASWLHLVRKKYFSDTGGLGVIFHQLQEPQPEKTQVTRAQSSREFKQRQKSAAAACKLTPASDN
jgi:CRP-like cAMP-binding protein